MLRPISILSAILLLGSSPAAHAQTACDRDCLHAIAWGYMDAMVRHDIKSQPVAADVKVTENTKEIKPGEGVFGDILYFKYPRQYVADAKTGQIGVLGVLADWGGESIFALRLKIENQQIKEIETLLSHEGESGPAFEPEGFLLREAPYIDEIPTSVRTPREELLKIAHNYWTVVTTTRDVSKIAYTFGCFHFENGMNNDWEHPIYTEKSGLTYFVPDAYGRHWLCKYDVSENPWGPTAQVRDYRAIADEERGLVMSWNLVDIIRNKVSGKEFMPSNPDVGEAALKFQKNTTADGASIDEVPPGLSVRGMAGQAGNHTVYHVEIERIIDGKIDRHQDFLRFLPENTQSPW